MRGFSTAVGAVRQRLWMQPALPWEAWAWPCLDSPFGNGCRFGVHGRFFYAAL
jgi:hypothetical protein